MLDQIETVTETSSGGLLLRMTGGNDTPARPATQLVRITARRCTIGTDKSCNLRLGIAGVEPVGCLIVRGDQNTIVRRWSSDALLNGHESCDAVLSTGDRFAVGPCEFEVLDLASAAATGGDEAIEAVVEVIEEPAASLQEIALRQWQSLTRLREANDLNRARARRLIKELRTHRRDAHEQALAASAAAASLRTGEHTVEPVDDLIELSEQPTGETQSDQDELRFEAVSADAPVTASALLERFGASMPVDDRDESPNSARRHTPLGADRGERAEQRLCRGHETASLPTEDERAGSVPSAGEATMGEHKDESIDDYMVLLMQRLGKKPSAEASSYRPSTVEASSPAATPQQKLSKPVELPERPALLTELPSCMTAAPERAADMSAMRELAHLHTRSLLDIHFRRRFFRASVGQLLVVAVAFIIGISLILLSTELPIALFPGLIAFAVAIVWGAQYAFALWHVSGGSAFRGRQKRAPTNKNTSEPRTEQQAIDAETKDFPVIEPTETAANG